MDKPNIEDYSSRYLFKVAQDIAEISCALCGEEQERLNAAFAIVHKYYTSNQEA